jgi:hypothetical protein
MNQLSCVQPVQRSMLSVSTVHRFHAVFGSTPDNLTRGSGDNNPVWVMEGYQFDPHGIPSALLPMPRATVQSAHGVPTLPAVAGHGC